ncbi:MAG TPA: protein translocase subunit SecF [Bacillota bacterium]|nr:protein translocase subunit SecF [Bacillota bacterium]HPT86672.1 protein translocase subunit SecF [Bacillota bacterium]
MNILKYRWFFIGIFIITMVLSVTFLFVNPYNNWGTKPGPSINLGIDFTGGTKIYFPVSRPVSSDEVAVVLDKIDLPNFKYNPPQPNEFYDSKGERKYQVIVYTSFLNDTEQDIVVKALEDAFGKTSEHIDITRVDPLIGQELVRNAVTAVAIASLLMLIYIWFRFELASGIASIIALIHDSVVVLGMFALFGQEFNATIIGALLTIVGYSINDTIVVFDRIRENQQFKSKDISFSELANDSILQTFRRSLNTGLTTILAVCVLFLMVPSVQEFCFALIVGLVAGTYSSIFVASPIWTVFKEWQESKRKQQAVSR